MTVQTTDNDAKTKALATALSQVEKEFGKGAIQKLGDDQAVNVVTYSSGSLTLDRALGIGGFPAGRIIEVYGPESSGKTSLCLSAIAEIQRQGGRALFVDAEHALDPRWAEVLGVDTDELYISQPDSGEDSLRIAEKVIQSRAIDIVVVDSVASLLPKAELEGDIGDSSVGLQARMMSQALRKLRAVIHQTGTMVIFTNQIRHKIGVMFGSPETTSGGNALKFYASLRLDVRRIGSVKGEGSGNENSIGNQVKVSVKKNKLAPPFRVAVFNLLFETGFDRLGEIVDLGVESGVIEKSGAWYSRDGQKLGQGRQRVVDLLADDPAFAERLKHEVCSTLGMATATPDAATEREVEPAFASHPDLPLEAPEPS